MSPLRFFSLIFASLVLCFAPARAQQSPDKSRIRFRITLSEQTAPSGAAGRLLVFMTNDPTPRKTIGTGFVPGSTYVAALEIEHFGPGSTIELDPDILAFPEPFSRAKPGNYQAMVLLDQDHSYNYNGEGEGDIKSNVEVLKNLDPATSGPIDLTLSSSIPAQARPTESESVKTVEFQSPALTEFWGRPIVMRAAIALPPDYATQSQGKIPTVYHIHGFGGNASGACWEGNKTAQKMADGKMPAMVHVFLDASAPGGHHAFADSVNNGPWGRALTTELIPHLEQKFQLVQKPHARFLRGHSSGGWSTLWLQVTYPEFFGGTWSTAPDPVDLRNYTGINATPGSTDNAYRESDGSPKQLVRMGGKWVAGFEDFARQELVIGEHGGQFASFEWVWSPRGPDGCPLQMFNRKTGALNPAVLEAWQRYDIRRILDKNWDTLVPKLEGKLHLFCGSEDQFRLNESFALLREFLLSKNSTAVCELIDGRSHNDLYNPHPSYPQGLAARIYAEMEAKFEAAKKDSALTAQPTDAAPLPKPSVSEIVESVTDR